MPLDTRANEAFNDIRRAFENGRLAQAYLVVGPPREGGGALAQRVLALLFCEAASERPCGACPACQAAESGRLPDVMTLEPVKKAQMIDIKQIRDLTHFMGQTSFVGGWKAGVLLYADRITTGAANAFLKVLEEPPPRSLFLLLSEQPSSLLPTILSRCHKVSAATENAAAIRPWMDRLAPMLEKGAAGPLDALGAAAELGALLAEKRHEIETMENENPPLTDNSEEADEILDARIAARYKEARAVMMRALLLWHRDALAVVSGADSTLLVYADKAESLRAQAARLTVAQALARVEAVEEMQAQLEQNVNESVVLQDGMTRLAESEPAPVCE